MKQKKEIKVLKIIKIQNYHKNRNNSWQIFKILYYCQEVLSQDI